MKSLYLLLDALTIVFPFILSFDKKVAYYKSWKYLSYGFLFVGIPFIVWDIIFTANGFWGFNPTYLTGINIGNLPIEEVLFFVVVPFSCTFIYACVKAYFPRLKLKGFNTVFYASLAIYSLFLFINAWSGWYTLTASIFAIVSIPILRRVKINLDFLPLSFLIALIPFFMINGVLTGTGIDAPIVWYNDLENTGLRFATIPFEDVVYGWTLIAGNIAVFEWFISRKSTK